MKTNFTELGTCLACGEAGLSPLLDLGTQPLANSYHKKEENLPSFPLGVNLCLRCFHVQQFVAVNPDLMFKEYLYVSGTSNTLREYFDWFAREVDARWGADFNAPKKVLDIACNDGTQLASFMRLGWEGHGVDPAENLMERAQATGASVTCDYWNTKSAQALGEVFDVLIAQNVFAHVADPYGFLNACKLVMRKGSKLLIQTSQADMFSRGEFDTIYHEHISFFSARSLQTLAHRAGLSLEEVFITPVHGGSYVFVLSLDGDETKGNERVGKEEKDGRYDIAMYNRFADIARAATEGLKKAVDGYRTRGIPVVGFGAAAKGNTVLNFGHIALDYIVDDNPLKQNLLTPGMDIPIYPPQRLSDEKGSVLVVPLAWNFFDEIYHKVKKLRPTVDDVFITYFPSLEERR